MKKMMTSLLLAAMVMTVPTACSSDDPLSTNGGTTNWGDDNNSDNNSNSNGSISGNGGSSTGTYSEMNSFSIAIDKTTAEPTDVATAQYPDGVSAYNAANFGTTVNIDMTSPVDPAVTGVTVKINGNNVTVDHGSTAGICYVVSGETTNGSLTIKGEADFALKLNNAVISNTSTIALDIESSKNAYLVVSGTNKLTDGTSAADSHKGAVFAKGALLISGDGSLEVYGTYKNGIHGKSNIVVDKGVNLYVNSTANNGIKAGGDIFINGGIINVEVSADAGKAINGDANVTINGGRTTVIATGNGTWEVDETLATGGDTKAAAGIGSDANFYMNGGELYAKATGSGGKGVKADEEAYITGGKIRIITEGGLYYSNGSSESHNYTGNTDNLASAYTSSPKGMKIGTKDDTVSPTVTYGVLKISGGDIMVRTSGNNAEGIESKGTLDISGGTVLVYAYDDAINSTGDLTISGGTVVAVGTNNDAIDANGNMNLTGGTIIACGAGGAESGIDVDESHSLTINNCYLFGIGGRIDAKLGSTSQGIISATASIAANSTVSISNSSKTLYSFTMPPTNVSGTMLISTPDLSNGSSYTLTAGSNSATVTASNTIASSGMGGGPGGGGQPGGGPGGR